MSLPFLAVREQGGRVSHRMNEILLSLLAGLLVGFLFSAIKLPLPAPPVLAGVMGIVGIWLGGALWKFVVVQFFS